MKLNRPQDEMTYCMVKPDGTTRGLIGEIIHRFEKAGLKIVALELAKPSRDDIDNHYPKDETWIQRLGEKTLNTYEKYGYNAIEELGTDNKAEIGKMVREWLLSYMTSAPVVKMVVQGVHAIDMVRKMAGHTIPALADIGTIRGDFSVDSAVSANKDKRAIMNLVHASETQEEATHEIDYWFKKEQIHSYKTSAEWGEGA